MEFAAEPDSGSRQLQEKAGGVAPAGFFSGRSKSLGLQAHRRAARVAEAAGV